MIGKSMLQSECKQIQVCRGCLAVDPMLLYLDEISISQTYESLIGIPLQSPHALCQYCAGALRNFARFRARCARVARLLPQSITKEHAIHLISSNPEFKPRFLKTEIVTLDILTESSQREQTEIADSIKIEKSEKVSDDEIDDTDDTSIELTQNSEIIKEIPQRGNPIEFCEVAVDLLNKPVIKPKNDAKIKTEASKNSKRKRNNTKKTNTDAPKGTRTRIKGLEMSPLSKFTRIIIEHAKSYSFEPEFLSHEEQRQQIEAKKREPTKIGFKCELCGKRFRESNTMERHKNNHLHKPNSYTCDICFWVFKNKIRLIAHLKAHSWSFTCRICGFKTSNQSDLRVHHEFHKGKKYSCKFCGVVFNKKSTHLTHVRMGHTDELSFCELCGEMFIGVKGLVIHQNLAHNDMEFSYKCETCAKKFKSQAALDRHFEVGGCSLPSCAQCGERFPHEHLLKYHLVQRHVRGAAPASFPCERCRLRFHTRAARAAHACGGAGAACAQCGEGLPDHAALVEHFKLRHDILKCEECNKTFGSAVYFKRHRERSHVTDTHTDSRRRGPGPTTQRSATQQRKPSGKSSVRKWRVVGPELLKEQPEEEREEMTKDVTAVCEVCGKGFKGAWFLKQHQALAHSQTNHFFCPRCPKGFKTKNQLKLHSAVHTGERPHQCPLCLKAFKIPSAYYRHRLVHSGERKHVCSLCDRTFQTSTSVKLHLTTAHLRLPWPKRSRRKRDEQPITRPPET